MLDPQKLHGVIPPVITPLTTEGRLDVPAFEHVLRFLMENGVHGLFVLGSTSEFSGLVQADRYLSMETAVKVAAGKGVLWKVFATDGTQSAAADGTFSTT